MTPVATHVAILLPRYIRLILDGVKTVESRLTITRRAPFRLIAPGDRIYFKASSGPFRATAVAGVCEFHDNLTPSKVAQLRRRFNRRVCGDDAYWNRKREARFATFVTLRHVEHTTTGPAFPKSQGIAWFVLDTPSASPPLPSGEGRGEGAPELTPRSRPHPRPKREHSEVITIPITPGALRNHYLRLSPAEHPFPPDALGGRTRAQAGKPFELVLPDGRVISTDIVMPTRIFRWRGWGRYFAAHGVQPGERVRFVCDGPRRYRVEFAAKRS